MHKISQNTWASFFTAKCSCNTVNEIEQFAKALMQCQSFKDRQQLLNESLDHMSFNYPDLYSAWLIEVKRRDMEYNDPNEITKWSSSSNLNRYVKIHEALLLVKSYNNMALDKYLEILNIMLHQTIENGSNIEDAMKVCCLIEKSKHLTTIYESLKHLIEKVKQLNHNNPTCSLKNIWNYDFKPFQTNSFKLFDNQTIHQEIQQQHIPVRSNTIRPTSLNSAQDLPYFNQFPVDCFGYDHLRVIATANDNSTSQQTQQNVTIISQDMDGAFLKWLRYLKLHKYQWFFTSLSYLEIECIDEDNIDGFINKVNLNSITKGAKKKICVSTQALRDRPQKFKDLLMALDLEVTHIQLCEHMTYMRDILHYPLPNKNCVVDDQLQQDIILIMEKSLNQILEMLKGTSFLIADSLLGTSINKFLECSLLITGNQTFSKEQYEKTKTFAGVLKYQVYQVPRNFS